MIKRFLLLGLIILLVVLFTWPSILHISSQYIGDGRGDNYEYASYVKLVTHNITQGHLPYSYTTFWRYPQGFNFYLGSDSYLTTLTAGIMAIFIGSVLAYSLVILLLLVLNGVLSYLFFKALANSKLLGIAGMITYGLSFNALTKLGGHANLIFNGGFSLLAFSLLKILSFRNRSENKHRALKYIVLALFSILLTACGSTEYFFILVLFAPLIIIAGGLVFRQNVREIWSIIINQKWKLIICLGVFTLLITGFYSQHIMAFITNQIILPNRETVLRDSTPSIIDFFLPNSYMRLLIGGFLKNPSLSSIERSVFFGWAELFLFILFFFLRIPKKIKAFLLISFLIPFVLSLGYGNDNHFFLLPYRFLSRFFPFNTVVQTGRYVVVAYFFSTIAIVLALKSLRNKFGIVIVVVFLLLIFAERLPNNIYLSPTLENKPYYQVVAKTLSSAVLDLPINLDQRNYDIASFYYNKPIVNGYFHYFGDGKPQRAFILKNNLLSRYTCSELDPLQKNAMDNAYEANLDSQMIKMLKENGILTMVIHKDDKFFFPACKNVRERLSRLIASDYVPLEITPANAEKQLQNYFWEGKPSLIYYSPYGGKVYLDGVYIAPRSQTSFNISVDGKPLRDYSWSVHSNYSMELSPKYTIVVDVKPGSLITFESQDQIYDTYFSLWYRYIPDSKSLKVTYEPKFQKLFEDNSAIVYQLK